MGLISYTNGQTSVILRVKILDSSTMTGGKTGLAYNTSGLRISTIADNESSATAYTVAGTTIETISTLGTFATPTATKCRFKEVDATNHPGIYELQIDNARFAVSNAKSLVVSITGASGACDCDVVIPLTTVNPYVTAGKPPVKLDAADVTGNLPTNVVSFTSSAITESAFATNSITKNNVAANALNNVTIDGVPILQQIAIIASAAAGTSSGVSTGSPVYKNINGSTTRISANASSGDRATVTLTLPALPS